MKLLADSCWRAAAYCLRPRVIALSVLPLLLLLLLAMLLGYFYWTEALDWVRTALAASALLNTVWGWLEALGLGQLKTLVAPLIVIFSVTPMLVVLSLLVVAFMMSPALVALVAARRFPALEKKAGHAWLIGWAWSLGSTLLALLALLVSLPLWLVPPLILVLPPLIWGWLTYRVMAFDALSSHASRAERIEIFRRHRLTLLLMGVITGYLGAAPSLLWASGALFAAAFMVLIPLAIWAYTGIFVFSSLWFAHYCLQALAQLRAEQAAPATPAPASGMIEVSAQVVSNEQQPPTPPASLTAP